MRKGTRDRVDASVTGLALLERLGAPAGLAFGAEHLCGGHVRLLCVRAKRDRSTRNAISGSSLLWCSTRT